MLSITELAEKNSTHLMPRDEWICLLTLWNVGRGYVDSNRKFETALLISCGFLSFNKKKVKLTKSGKDVLDGKKYFNLPK